MRILVGAKRVIDYAVKPQVQKDGSGVNLKNVKMSMNPFCEIAVEEAVRLKENDAAERVVALSIGPKQCTETLRTALAMGCDEAIHLSTDLRTDYMELQPYAIAKIFREIINREKFDLVLLGKQGIDSDCGQTGPMLAGFLGWPQVTFAAKLTVGSGVGDDGGATNSLTVERETDSGTETIRIPSLPAVVTCDLRLNEPRYATLPNIMKAKKKKIKKINVDDLGVDLTAYNKVVEVFEPYSRKEGVMVENVDELLDKLRNEAGVIA